jgi:hypothetical protein
MYFVVSKRGISVEVKNWILRPRTTGSILVRDPED